MDKKIYFSGAKGYNNGVYILNDICKTLYSNKDLGVTARSINIEDIEAGFNEAGEINRNNCNLNPRYGKTKTYTSNLNYPVIYANENGSGIGVTEEDAETGIKKEGIEESEPYYNEEQLTTKPEKKESDKASNALTCKQTYYYLFVTNSYCKNDIFHKMIFGTNSSYWLASRCVSCVSDTTAFGLRYVSEFNLFGESMFSSSDYAYDYGHYLRPAVSVGSNVTIQTVVNNSMSTPHKILGLE